MSKDKYTFSDLPEDVKARLVKSMAAVSFNDRKHEVQIDFTACKMFILFEGYKLTFEMTEGDTE